LPQSLTRGTGAFSTTAGAETGVLQKTFLRTLAFLQVLCFFDFAVPKSCKITVQHRRVI
jgi:hypothetical protein